MEEVVHLFCFTPEANSKVNRWKLQEGTFQINNIKKQNSQKLKLSKNRTHLLRKFRLPPGDVQVGWSSGRKPVEMMLTRVKDREANLQSCPFHTLKSFFFYDASQKLGI